MQSASLSREFEWPVSNATPADGRTQARARSRLWPGLRWVVMTFAGVIAATLFPVGLARAQAEVQPIDTAEVHRFVEESLEAHRIPGVVLAVTSPKQTLFERAWGRSGGETPLSVTTPFLIGSLSKSFTAIAILRLVEQRAIGLDDAASIHVPVLRTANNGSEAITIRQLLQQTSGLSRSTGLSSFGEGQSSRQLVEGLTRSPLRRRPGAAFEYSNANYWVLGRIVELASGVSYPDYMEREIFRPLSLERTTAVFTDAERWGLASGHRVWFGFPVAARIPFEGGATPAVPPRRRRAGIDSRIDAAPA